MPAAARAGGGVIESVIPPAKKVWVLLCTTTTAVAGLAECVVLSGRGDNRRADRPRDQMNHIKPVLIFRLYFKKFTSHEGSDQARFSSTAPPFNAPHKP